MSDGLSILIPRRLLSVSKFSEAIELEQNRLLAAVKRDDMVSAGQLLSSLGRLSFVLGDPGLGKTFLMRELSEVAQKDGQAVVLKTLKEGTIQFDVATILLELPVSDKGALVLFDGLDELKSSEVVHLDRAVNDLMSRNPQLKVVISSRTTVAQRYEAVFSSKNPDLWLLSRLSDDEVIAYIRASGIKPALVERAKDWLRLDRGTHIVSVPRYLNYICQYLQGLGDKTDVELPRLNVIFAAVVKSALKQEISAREMISNAWVAERVLAKLALVMEIAQTNSITHDELLTFFDTVTSDLKVHFLSPVAFAELSEHILKFDGERCSFHDREIQEFLASTELARLPEPRRALFTLCFDDHSRILKPSWFNCLRFLFDRHPTLFADVTLFLLSISVASEKTFYTLDEAYWVTAPIFRKGELPSDRAVIFFDQTIDYFRSTRFWLDYDAAFSLASVFTPEMETYLSDWKSSLGTTNVQQRVNKSNLARLIGELRSRLGGSVIGLEWQTWLLEVACGKNEDPVAIRTALWALRYFEDESIISKVAHLTSSRDQFIKEALVQVCAGINPAHPDAISLLLNLLRNDTIGAFSALMKCKEPSGRANILQQLADDDNLIRATLNELTRKFSAPDGFLEVLFTSKIDEQVIAEPMQRLICKMIATIGTSSRHEPEIFTLCQTFAANNESILIAAVKAVLESSAEENEWSLERGISYFITSENKVTIFDALRTTNARKFSDYFFSRLESDIANRSERNSPSPSNNPRKDSRPEEVSLKQDLQDRIASFSTRPDYSVVEDLLREVETLYRNNKTLNATNIKNTLSFIEQHIFDKFDPAAGKISLNKEVSHRSWTISSFLPIFGMGIQVYAKLGGGSDSYRNKLIQYLPFSRTEEIKWVCEQISPINKAESDQLCGVFISSEAHRAINISNLLAVSKHLHPTSVQETFPTLLTDSKIEGYEQRQILSALVEKGISKVQLEDFENKLRATSERSTIEHINGLLIQRFNSYPAAKWRVEQLILRAGVVPMRRGAQAFSPTVLESEMWEKEFAKPLLTVSIPEWKDLYLQILKAGFLLASQSEQLVTYADYLWDIVCKYTENLLTHRSYKPLIELENEVAKHFELEGANWIQGKLARLRNAYTATLGKPTSFISAALEYNASLNALVSPIEHSSELVQLVVDVLNDHVASWLTGTGRKLIEGAYNSTRQREVALQRLLKVSLMEGLNYRRHSQYSFSVVREPQLDDDRRTDLLISYGFVGPCLFELKLSSHKDLKRKNVTSTASFQNLNDYMRGYRCNAGILVILIDLELSESKRQALVRSFGGIEGLRTLFVPLPSQIRSRTVSKKVSKMTKRKAIRKETSITKKSRKANKRRVS